MNTTAIATHLNIAQTAIVRIEEWANVLFVVAKGISARFVSKKINVEEKKVKPTQKPFKVYQKFDAENFATLIERGAGRRMTWETPHGEAVAKLAHDGVIGWHYALNNGSKIDATKLMDSLDKAGVAVTKTVLSESDCWLNGVSNV
jgi:hypothetical protein